MRDKTLRSIVLGTILAISLTGCKQCKTEYSPIKTETAVVTEKYHRNSYVTPIHAGKVHSFVSHPAVNRVSFDGAIDFQIDSRELYDAFNERDSAVIHYRDVYQAIYSSKDENGRRNLLSKELKQYDFIDAVKK